MGLFSSKNGNTEKDTLDKLLEQLKESLKENANLQAQIKILNEFIPKYKKLRKKYAKTVEQIGVIQGVIDQLQNEQSVSQSLLFVVAVKCGGKIEITNNDMDVAKKMQNEHTLDFKEDGDSISILVKRTEK